jgi:hypothetical protein
VSDENITSVFRGEIEETEERVQEYTMFWSEYHYRYLHCRYNLKQIVLVFMHKYLPLLSLQISRRTKCLVAVTPTQNDKHMGDTIDVCNILYPWQLCWRIIY